MFSLMLRAVGQFIVVSAVLMFAVMFIVPCVTVEALYCFLGCDITVLIVSIIVLADHPSAFVAGIF